MPPRNKPGVAFWTAVGLVVMLVGYPLSFGPACWISSWTGRGAEFVTAIYGPLVKLRSPAEWCLSKFSQLAARRGWAWSANESRGKDWHWGNDY
jgi:hypothetical protein